MSTRLRKGAGLFVPKKFDMFSTCKYAYNMSKMIQVRNVPESLHRTLKARAAMAGMSLSDYLLSEFREIADRPTLKELQQRLENRRPVNLRESASVAVRLERDTR